MALHPSRTNAGLDTAKTALGTPNANIDSIPAATYTWHQDHPRKSYDFLAPAPTWSWVLLFLGPLLPNEQNSFPHRWL